MYFFRIKTFAVTASFRIPESHTFQQTLPLPPITALTGLVGAAVGLKFEDAMKFRNEKELRFGVLGNHQGEFKDLWKYRKIKSKEIVSDVLMREYLADLEMSLYIGSESHESVKYVRECFLCPCYALTAGNSDDLIKVIKVGEIKDADETPLSEFRNTVLEGDHSANCDTAVDLKTLPITETIRAPRVYLIPTEFNFNGEERRVSSKKHFTFIGSPIKLKQPVSGIKVDDEAIVFI